MNYSKDLARALCEQMGVKWNYDASAPRIRDAVITAKDIGSIFSPTRPVWSEAQAPFYCDLNEFISEDTFSLRSSVVIDRSVSESTFDGTPSATLAA